MHELQGSASNISEPGFWTRKHWTLDSVQCTKVHSDTITKSAILAVCSGLKSSPKSTVSGSKVQVQSLLIPVSLKRGLGGHSMISGDYILDNIPLVSLIAVIPLGIVVIIIACVIRIRR